MGPQQRLALVFEKQHFDCICEIWSCERESHDCRNLTELRKLGQAETENRNNAHTASNSSILLSCNNLKK